MQNKSFKKSYAFLPVIIASLVFFSCGDAKPPLYDRTDYRNSVLDLGLGFSAKEFCSCVWVMEMEREYCKEHVKLKQIKPKFTIDEKSKTVETRAFLFFRKKARFVNERFGCMLL